MILPQLTIPISNQDAEQRLDPAAALDAIQFWRDLTNPFARVPSPVSPAPPPLLRNPVESIDPAAALDAIQFWRDLMDPFARAPSPVSLAPPPLLRNPVEPVKPRTVVDPLSGFTPEQRRALHQARWARINRWRDRVTMGPRARARRAQELADILRVHPAFMLMFADDFMIAPKDKIFLENPPMAWPQAGAPQPAVPPGAAAPQPAVPPGAAAPQPGVEMFPGIDWNDVLRKTIQILLEVFQPATQEKTQQEEAQEPAQPQESSPPQEPAQPQESSPPQEPAQPQESSPPQEPAQPQKSSPPRRPSKQPDSRKTEVNIAPSWGGFWEVLRSLMPLPLPPLTKW